MATVERGKGKRKQIIEIVQFGDVLRMQETDAGDERLPGYRRCASEAAARAALIAEVRAHLDAGMQPADDEARAVAASAPAKKAGPPSLPIRQDLGIYNEATGFVVTSRRMAGKTLEEGSAAWKKAVTKGDMLPLSLIQDDPFIIRVVTGDALTAQENAEWVARVDWHLNVPDGKLCITGGSVFTNEDYEDEDPHQEQYVGQVLVPKGHYGAKLYSLSRGLGDGAYEPAEGEDDERELVDFLLHLDPIEGAPKSGLSTLPDDGWFSGEENARTLNGASGLPAHDVLRPREDSPGQWTYVWRVFEQLPKHDRRPVKGDAVSLPLESLARAGGIAWYGSRFTTMELRLSAPPGGTLDLGGEWPEGMVAVNEGGTGRIFYSNDLDIHEFLTRLPALGPRLAQLREGTVLDLCSIATTSMPGSPEGAGTIYLRGLIRGGSWRIAQAYPEVDAATLTAAMAFVAEAEKTEPAAAIAQFAERFSQTWPVVVVRPEEPGNDDEDDDGMFPTTPIKGAEIFVAPGGREYHQTMALLVSEKVAAAVQKRERALVSAGFKHVNDLVCSASGKIAYRGYTKAGGHAWAYFKVSFPDRVALEIATTFANENDAFVTEVPADATFKDRLEQHQETVEVLVEQFGDAQPTASTSRNFAETIEAVLLSA